MTASINVPFVNLGLQFKKNENDFQLLLNEIGNNGHYIMGKYLELFENQFASYCNTNFAVGVANATDGLTLSMKALNIGAGDEVITATNSFISSVSSIANLGATPVLVDTCHCYNINPDDIERKITNTHLLGRRDKS